MVARINRNRNTNPVADNKVAIAVNDTTAVTLDAADTSRIFFEVSILPAVTDVCVFIRIYPASDDNIERGVWIGRFNFGNDVFFRPSWRMPEDNICTDEISAILLSGDPDENVYVVTY